MQKCFVRITKRAFTKNNSALDSLKSESEKSRLDLRQGLWFLIKKYDTRYTHKTL